jgi:hypothetical protein
VIEIAVIGSAGENQIVIVNSPEITGYGFLSGIDPLNLTKQHPCIFILREKCPDGGRDIGRTETCHGDLIKQGLKEIVIAAINDGDFDVGLSTKDLCGFDAAKSPTHNHDVFNGGKHDLPFLRDLLNTP